VHTGRIGKIFKTNDIRGLVPEELDDETVFRIGFSLPELLGASSVLVGRDARLSSERMFQALSRGIMAAGADVADIGVCDTPAVYFAANQGGFTASVMITASHNPPDCNGLKISRAGAAPVGAGTGLDRLAVMIERPPRRTGAACRRGTLRRLDIADAYLDHLERFAGSTTNLRVAVDCSNGSAGVFLPALLARLDGSFLPVCEVPDGRFPQHGPDPLQPDSRRLLRQVVLREKADAGVLFDGDADRAVFLDENGVFVSPDMITALLALHFFKHRPRDGAGSRLVLYDIRSSRSVADFVKAAGGRPRACPTGHARIKDLLRSSGGLYAGELAGHYYFRDNYCCDSGFIAFLLVLSVMSAEGRSLSRLIEGINPYCFSGEISFPIENAAAVYRRLRRLYPDGVQTAIDGLRVDFPDWWFIVRQSNAEPVMRLVVEASSPEQLRCRTAELSAALRHFTGKPAGM
jgi:phosphomannomutase